MKKFLRGSLMVLLTVVLIGSLGMMGWQYYQSRLAAAAYEEAQALAMQQPALPDETLLPEENVPAQQLPEEIPPEIEPVEEPVEQPEEQPAEPLPEEPTVWREAPVLDDPYMEELKKVDLESLRAVNPDVVGWIVIPGTQVEYPLMQGEDNAFYLNHTWKKAASSAGSIFLEQSASADLSDFNTIVYGHRMINDSMFGSLKYYKDQKYWSSHPYVYILDDAGAHRYEIFSAYEASVKGYTYQIGFADDAAREKFLDKCTGWSVIETNVVPTIRDRILTLSTCTGKGYDTRWVVQARLAAAE